jgi:hypothetical protein
MNVTRRRFLTFGLPALAFVAAAGCDSKPTDHDASIQPPPPTPLKKREPPTPKK